jgi:hypothetical protein
VESLKKDLKFLTAAKSVVKTVDWGKIEGLVEPVIYELGNYYLTLALIFKVTG